MKLNIYYVIIQIMKYTIIKFPKYKINNKYMNRIKYTNEINLLNKSIY